MSKGLNEGIIIEILPATMEVGLPIRSGALKFKDSCWSKRAFLVPGASYRRSTSTLVVNGRSPLAPLSIPQCATLGLVNPKFEVRPSYWNALAEDMKINIPHPGRKWHEFHKVKNLA